MAAPKNIQELREQLLESFDAVKRDPRRLAQAAELTNTAGKIIDTVKLEITYHGMKGEEPAIPFLGQTSGIALKSGAKLLKG